MKLRHGLMGVASVGLAAAGLLASQDGRPGGHGAGIDPFLSRLMAFDADKDGSLSRKELSDDRLANLFDRADSDRDGTLTTVELKAFYEKEAPSLRGGPGGPGGGPGGPPDDFGGPGGPGGPPPGRGGPGGPGGPGGRGGGGQVGLVISPTLQDQLELSDDQRAQIQALQKDVDARLAKILTEEQRTQLVQLRRRRPGGGGGPGGPPPEGEGPPQGRRRPGDRD